MKPMLKQRQTKKKRTEYFVPDSLMTDKMREAYKNDFIEIDDDSDMVESILGDVTDGITMFPSNSEELNAARLENIKARTSLINERLEAHKQELWAEWNEAVFDEFASAFARVKNALIALQLNEDQIATLNAEIESAVNNLSNRLEGMWNDFNKEEDEEED